MGRRSAPQEVVLAEDSASDATGDASFLLLRLGLLSSMGVDSLTEDLGGLPGLPLDFDLLFLTLLLESASDPAGLPSLAVDLDLVLRE